ncbi:transposase [Ureibacillus terrenus]|uniref:Transposase n=2 Tax=Ureibacillus terrenus TaxID=118246 RepID=A0A540UV84_9BACL|nr:transposase [Ureibacillus terrenus]
MEMASLCFINDWIMANSNGHEIKMKFVGSRNNNFVAFDERNYPAFFKWLEKQLSSPNNHLYDYALRLRRDLQSIKLAFSTSYSNGVVEGHVHRLKLMKRIMYGRAKLDLLEKRVLYHL